MEDIAPKLLEILKTSFSKLFEADTELLSLYSKIEKGIATYDDANRFAIKTGEVLANTLSDNISSNILPDGKLYYNIAKRTVEPMMINNFDLISDYCTEVQQLLNKSANIGIKAHSPILNQDRIDGVIDIVSGKEYYDDIAYMLDDPMINFSQAIVDDAVRVNADFQYKSGMSPKIIRTVAGSCCDWCSEVSGTFNYEDVKGPGNDIFRRHRYCRCTVNYIPFNGKVQNAHSKKWISEEEYDKIEVRKNIEFSKLIYNGESDVIQRAIRNGEVLDSINKNKQLRHLISSPGYIEGRSYLYGTIEDADALYHQLKGTGEPIVLIDGWKNKEKVESKEIIGVVIDNLGNKKETNKAMIVYSKTGSHIYPKK